MNQILVMENKKKKRSRNTGPAEIENILKFFAVSPTIRAERFVIQVKAEKFRMLPQNTMRNYAEFKPKYKSGELK